MPLDDKLSLCAILHLPVLASSTFSSCGFFTIILRRTPDDKPNPCAVARLPVPCLLSPSRTTRSSRPFFLFFSIFLYFSLSLPPSLPPAPCLAGVVAETPGWDHEHESMRYFHDGHGDSANCCVHDPGLRTDHGMRMK